MFIEHKVDLEVPDSYEYGGNTPIHYMLGIVNQLISGDQLKIIKMLFENQTIDLNVMRQDGMRPFHLICSGENNMNTKDQMEAIELFVKNAQRVDLYAVNEKNEKPVHLICGGTNKMTDSDKLKIVKMLI